MAALNVLGLQWGLSQTRYATGVRRTDIVCLAFANMSSMFVNVSRCVHYLLCYGAEDMVGNAP